MKKVILFVFIILLTGSVFAQAGNLVLNGDFKSLKQWKTNKHLAQKGKVTLVPGENAVTIFNPVVDVDGSIYQQIKTNGKKWFTWSAGIRAGVSSGATIAIVAVDKSGNELRAYMLSKDASVRPYKPNFRLYEGHIEVPDGTVELNVVLTVLGGTSTFTDIVVSEADGPERIASRKAIIPGKGFTVEAFNTERPFWNLYADDLDADGNPEIISCDDDGIVTVRNQGRPPFVTYAPGALVYEFETADLNGDGTREILMSSIDPKIPVRAIDTKGNVVLEIEAIKGFQRISAADMDGDGKVEIALSTNNLIATSGLADGIALFSSKGEKIWEKKEPLRNFHFADLLPEPGVELVAGGPKIEFRVYNKAGKELAKYYVENSDVANFTVTDINIDGKKEIVASVAAAESSNRKLLCIDGNNKVWENTINRQLGNPENYIAVADFDPGIPGLETVTVSPHTVFVYDSKGTAIYESRDEENWEYYESWMPAGINSLDIGFWDGKEPFLYLSSSRFRHNAYYRIKFGKRDELRSYLVPDQEKHLEDIYQTLRKQKPQPFAGKEKVKIFIANDRIMSLDEQALRLWRKVLDTLETPGVEYLFMSTASDLKGHRRGYKMPTEKIVEQARLFEKTGIPFGFFICHSGQPWTSDEAIAGCKKAAPEMFRFVYLAENLEILYSPLYKKALEWTDKTLGFCARNNMKVIFKEKHDVWGLMPSEPDVYNVLFKPEYKNTTVPIWSTNQPYQPEIQLGGMVGLKGSGLISEFGMSTQYWNWHEWGKYPRGIRDVSAYSVCPADIILRLDLMGLALGATWIHIEGQPYLKSNIEDGLVPMARRHRDLAYEVMRKNLLVPGELPDNINKVTIVRSLHSEYEKGKIRQERTAYPFYGRNTDELRKGFIPARYQFEAYSDDAFPYIGYSMPSNSITCFPETPNGWITVLPPSAGLSPGQVPLKTDGEKVMTGQEWKESAEAKPIVEKMISDGAGDIKFEAPGTCLIIKKDAASDGIYTLLLMDPGYLAPQGVSTTVKSTGGMIESVTDQVTGKSVKFSGYSCPVQVEPGAFRILRIRINNK